MSYVGLEEYRRGKGGGDEDDGVVVRFGAADRQSGAQRHRRRRGFCHAKPGQGHDDNEVGDIPGHVTGTIESSGLIFFSKGPSSGEIATTMATTRFDLVNGKGTFTSERVNTYPDGSTLSLKATGTQTPVDGG